MNGARIISGILGRTTVAGDQPAGRPSSAASQADEASPMQTAAGA